MAEKMAVAVDLGATRVRVCLGSKSGRIIRRESRRMVVGDEVEDYLGQITDVMRHLTKGKGKLDLQGICVASPGPLDLTRGLIVRTANLPFPEVPIVDAIREAFHGEVYLVNDANAAALGEWLRGAGKGRKNVFYLTISTGIGGGAVVDGKLLLGKEGNAAEVGHTTIDSSGRMTCGCGRRGHWEAYCSGSAIPRFARRLLDESDASERNSFSKSSLVRNLAKADAAAVFRAAELGDKFALRVIAEVGRLNAIGVANVTDAFDPEIVTIGGGVALNNPDAILSPIRKHVEEYAINRAPEVKITPLGDDAGLLGALSVAYDPGLIGR
jgi:glucokinase